MQTETVVEAEHAHRAVTGDWVVLIAAVAFIAGTVLPFMKLLSPPEVEATTLYNQTVGSASGLVERFGWCLTLYAGAVTAGTVAVMGIRLHVRGWVAPALVASVAAWSLGWIGVLLNYVSLSRWAFLVGYWWVMASLVLAIAGAIIALRSDVAPKDS